MRVMDELRESDRTSANCRTFEENLELMRRLAKRATNAYASMHGLTPEVARKEMRALSQLGRTACSFLDEDVAWVASQRQSACSTGPGRHTR